MSGYSGCRSYSQRHPGGIALTALSALSARTPACLVRLDLDRAEVDRLGRLLGRGTAIDQDLILVVAEAEELEKGLLQRVRPHPAIRASKPARR